MDLLTKELNERVTRTNAKKVLKLYKKLERQTGKNFSLRSPILSDMPKGSFNAAMLEDRLIRQMDAERECLEILKAVNLLEEREKQIIQLAYISATKYTNYKIGRELQYSERTIERFKSGALIQFAYAYKNGELLVWK
ncbi:ArpU family phage packaging/lysis transcriptional regulator [Enterococcus dongliensis]|uniref:ArpU family phage packaging/lysis transcriptional regulator n=1 Tax=Enterococcus dongliensis TaxID=2559925 RepID=UPI00288D4CC0|nr:ArpU family phage packaging/lysis transcriptional regulator [Enterococcus dongliensis]MDT2669502.1 ArpU family phage packaging/lysis transcriptional regulator [Enterococcus dongliensis]